MADEVLSMANLYSPDQQRWIGPLEFKNEHEYFSIFQALGTRTWPLEGAMIDVALDDSCEIQLEGSMTRKADGGKCG